VLNLTIKVKAIHTGVCDVVPTFLDAMLKDMEKAGIIKDATNPSDSERAQAINSLTAKVRSGGRKTCTFW
jgi:hypothetical protein